MNTGTILLDSRVRPAMRPPARGVALVFTLLILSLMIVLSLSMVVALSSQTLIGGYYRNFRGAFYAADSGLNITRQAMANQLLGMVPASIAIGAQPLSSASAASVQTFINSTYQSWTPINAGAAVGSWPGKFQVSTAVPATITLPAANCTFSFTPVGTVAGGPFTCTNLPLVVCSAAAGILNNCATNLSFKYIANYSLDVIGQANNSEHSELSENGSIVLNVNVSPPSGVVTHPSFAAWGTFIDQYPICSAMFVPGTLTGPFFTNDSWNFGSTGQYIFTDSVGSANSRAGYMYSDGACDQVAGAADTHRGTTISPQFQSGFNLGQPTVPLPTDSYSQKAAVLDSKGVDLTGNPEPNPSNAQMNAVLRDASGAKYPATGASSGVFLPYSVDASGNATFTGGGIYVAGNATVTLLPGSGSQQKFTIRQGSTTTTVTVDPSANTTTIANGSTSKTITGVPTQDDATGAFMRPATLLYVNGDITSLKGPGENQTAINDGAAVTVVSAGDVTITGDIRYKTEPVTTTQNQIVPGTSPACCNGTPADTLIPGHDKGQVLGIFTATGDVQMNNGQSSDNLWIDSSIAMISSGGSGGWINVGPHINTLTLLGGRIANLAKSGNTTTRNLYFDRRFASGGFAPPWYPSTTVTTVPTGVESSTGSTPVIQRVQWVCKSCT